MDVVGALMAGSPIRRTRVAQEPGFYVSVRALARAWHWSDRDGFQCVRGCLLQCRHSEGHRTSQARRNWWPAILVSLLRGAFEWQSDACGVGRIRPNQLECSRG